MRIKKWTTMLVAFAMVFSVIGFGFQTIEADAATKAPKKIYLKTNYQTIDIKGKATVSVKSTSPSNASKSVYWKSSNKKIATVSSTGVVTGKAKGTVTITATSKASSKVKKSIKIYVKQLSPRVNLPDKIYVYSGVAKSVKATVPSNRYNAGVIYKENSSLAYLTPAGKATTGYVKIKNNTLKKSSGYFTLTAYSKENSKIKDTCRVYVRKSITGLSFSKKAVELKNGATYKQTATIKKTTPAAYVKSRVYTSSNSKVVKVTDSSTGAVKAVAPGTATITAKAKYGYPAKATYKITVYDQLTPSNDGEYTIDTTKYNKYEVSATKDGKLGTLVLTNADIENITGRGNSGFDWTDSVDVRDNFYSSNFSYASGKDYMFKKEGTEVYIKYYGQPLLILNCTKDSVKINNNDYTITLYANDDGTGETFTLVKEGDSLTAAKGGYTFKLTRAGEDTTVTISSKTTTIEAVFTIIKSREKYKITIDPNRVEANSVVVKAYK